MLILSIILIGVFAAFAASHLVIAYRRIVRRERSFSSVPLVNGLIGSAGIYLFPDPRWSKWWWLPFMIDWGCVPLVFEWVVWRVMRRKKEH